MARFYGTIQGARGEATRLGHASSGLRVTAQSWEGRVYVNLSADGDDDRFHVKIVDYHGKTLKSFGGKFRDLKGGEQDDEHRR